MKILLTGASSYVGARLFLDLSKKFSVIGTYYGNKLSDKFIYLNSTNADEVKKVIDDYKPDIIVHAAANANARWCELNPKEAVALNQTSTQNIVANANDIKAKIILISSFAAINPENVYGKTKAASEEYIKQTKSGYIIIRPSLIIGYSPNTTNDRPFNRILKNLDEGTEAIYDNSWHFQPTYLGHISEVITEVLERNILNEIIHVAVKEAKTRYDIAKDILEPFNISVKQIDNHDTTSTSPEELRELSLLDLPQYSYEEIIKKIVNEIRNREVYSKI